MGDDPQLRILIRDVNERIDCIVRANVLWERLLGDPRNIVRGRICCAGIRSLAGKCLLDRGKHGLKRPDSLVNSEAAPALLEENRAFRQRVHPHAPYSRRSSTKRWQVAPR
jgi:hypothetical protein